jgi:uncharacterized protein YndB with AHSA1/START domain
MPANPSLAISKPSLTIKRRVNASPAKVFSAWTDPEKLKQWFLHPNLEPVLAESDPRVGGRYRIVTRSADGEEHDVSGTFREVVPDEKLVFTWAWRSTPERESLVTIALKGDGDGTLLTLTHEQFFDEAARDRHQAGWRPVLDRLEQLVPTF